ncbi:helix-turn-helix transcriptional regulator [Actinomadura scrupuli]|uniref:helix-turn-helix transcriptional regulator n=1 Tax=Actinomadura scrupuli TaxID=559629 RepID=UPI003D957BD6
MSDIAAIALLQDPIRRRLYDHVVAQDHEVSRNEAAEAAGVQRTLAAFHLDKLVDAGLLEAVFRRLGGRTGPGAGRPAKLYRASAAEHAVSLPPRDYRTAADLLAEAADLARLDGELADVARRRGRALGAAAGAGADVTALLAERGYAPVVEGAEIRLRNCPFHVLAEHFPPLVCGMNLALLDGLLEGAGAAATARLAARPGWCCVVVCPSKTNEH